MNAMCPKCDLELNEQMECAQCGYVGTNSFSANGDERPADVASFTDDPLDTVDLADHEAAVAGADDEPAEFIVEDDLLHGDEAASSSDPESAEDDPPDEYDEDADGDPDAVHPS